MGEARTIGSVIVTGSTFQSYTREPGLHPHESGHVTEYAILGGPLFIAAWAAGGGPVCGNVLERIAGNTNGYTQPISEGGQGCNWGAGMGGFTRWGG